MARTCTVCTADAREDIDLAIVSGQSHYAIAASFRVGHDAVQRHASNHLPQALQEAAERRADLRADDLLAGLLDIAQEARDALDRAKEAGNDRLAMVALREVRESIKILASMAPSPDEAEVQALIRALGRVLPRHPAAAADLAENLREEGQHALADVLGEVKWRNRVELQ